VSLAKMGALAVAVQETLHAAIQAGGSTLRDFVSGDNQAGYFQMQHLVYDRAGKACHVCGAFIRKIVQGQRSTFFCPTCQAR
jgi:formamidopyrimidine-DNA glycosylase